MESGFVSSGCEEDTQRGVVPAVQALVHDELLCVERDCGEGAAVERDQLSAGAPRMNAEKVACATRRTKMLNVQSKIGGDSATPG